MNTMVEVEAAFCQLTGGRLLDVATGGGAFAAWLADMLMDVDGIVGIDAKRWTNMPDDNIFDRGAAEFIEMDAHKLEFDDASFDTVAISYSLHHMADPVAVLAEMRRVLKPGGHLIVREMHQDDLAEAQRTGVLLHHWWAAVDRVEGITHNETYTRQGLLDLIAGCDLRDLISFEYADVDDDPFEEEQLALLRDRIVSVTRRAQNLPGLAHIVAQADDLAPRLDQTGWLAPPVIIAAGRK